MNPLLVRRFKTLEGNSVKELFHRVAWRIVWRKVGNKFGRGRPRGSPNKRTALMELMEDHGEEMIKQCKVVAYKGDRTALRLCAEPLPPCGRSNSRFRLREGTAGAGEGDGAGPVE
jgi:hypothetical protein